MKRFDFSYNEYQRFLERCPFTEEEKKVLEMRRKGMSNVQISMELNICDSTVTNRVNSICKKILKEI